MRRLEPPPLNRGQLLRPRLLGRLAGRWDRRATLVVAGPGFGKSTLLAQALHENRLAPRGTDHWLSLSAVDNDGRVLLTGLASALGLPPTAIDLTPAEAAEELAAAARSLPPATCLVLDDVHEIDVASDGHAVLDRFVSQLPLQCSVVLASRVQPSLRLSEWRAKALVDALDEDDLRYTADEIDAIATARGRGADHLDHGGWPALVELSMVTGLAGGEAYLREVVLGRLAPEQRRWIAALDAIEGGDLGLVAAATGAELDPDARQAIDRFPMMQRLGRSGVRPHALWQPILRGVLSAEDRSTVRRRAAEELLRRGRHDDALRLFASESDWDGVASVIADACKTGNTQVGFDVLDRWRRALPDSEQSRPEAMFAAGIAERASNTFVERTQVLLQDASLAFRERGQIGAEVATLAELAFVAREQGDDQRVGFVLGRLMELEAQGVPEVVALLRLGRAIVADAFDDDEQLLKELAPLRDGDLNAQWMSRSEWLRGHALTLLGRPEEGLPHALASYEIAEDDFLGARFLIAYIHWWMNADERAIASLPVIAEERDRSPFDDVYGGAMMATVHAYGGNIDIARESLAIARASAVSPTDDRGPRPEYVGLLCCAAASLAVAQGDDEAAADAVRAFFNEHDASTLLGRRIARRWSGLVYGLLPEQRDAIDAATYGPAIAEVRAIAQWFVGLREGARLAPPIESTERRLLNALPLRWAVEATARLAAFDLDAARRICEHLVSVRGSLVRTLLREHADRAAVRAGVAASGASEGARKLLISVPVAPAEPLVLRVLGPLEVARGGHVSTAGELRRERVRQLIVALLVLGPSPRDLLVDLFWPDLEPVSGLQNLRTTLNYAHRVLEPERGPGDAPFVLRQHGDMLTLTGTPWVESDLARFTRCIADAEAMRQNGVHSQELDRLEEALSLVRGEPLTDVTYEDWAAPHIRLISSRISAAAQRAAELRFASGDHALAQAHAAQCLRFDPWCEPATNILVSSLITEGRITAARDALQAWRKGLAEVGGDVRSPVIEMLERRLTPGEGTNLPPL